MSTPIFTYFRYDSTNIPAPKGIVYNFGMTMYHVDGSHISNNNISQSSLSSYVNNNAFVRQKLTTGSIVNSTIGEYDNVNFSIINSDSNSSFIIFVTQKAKNARGMIVDAIVDYFYIPNLISTMKSNTNLVYNTDNYYLLEMNAAVDSFNSLDPKPTSNPSGLTITNNPVQPMYETSYGSILDGIVDKYVTDKISSSGQTYTDNLAAQTKDDLFNDTYTMQELEMQATSIYNNSQRVPFYKKYVADNNYRDIDIFTIMNSKIYNTKCILPQSSINPTDTFESMIRLSLHYTM